jgi:glycosyltransferase involved in cell wall biosynthesis
MLLVLPLPFAEEGGRVLIEKQASNGIRNWLNHFDRVTLAAPIRHKAAFADSRVEYERVDILEAIGLRCVPLPFSYSLGKFLKQYHRTRAQLSALIEESDYLQFAVNGCECGDWAAVAAREASKQKRSFAVHTDWVTHRVTRLEASTCPIVRRTILNVRSCVQKAMEKSTIRKAKLGLFHGADCFEAYKALPEHAALVHDIHMTARDVISKSELDVKLQRVMQRDRPLQILYCGRAAEMKGPMDWLWVCLLLRRARVPFQATWLGDGQLLESMRCFVNENGLADVVALPGYVAERVQIIRSLRSADVLMFCHKTPESPRVLIESLISGSPLVGYESAYSRDLVCQGGGLFVESGGIDELAELIKRLNTDRKLLARLITEAAERGRGMTDEAVFAHRSELMRQYL